MLAYKLFPFTSYFGQTATFDVKLERTTNTKRVPREFKIKKLEEILIQKNCINCQIAITAIGHKASAIPLHPRVLNLSPGCKERKIVLLEQWLIRKLRIHSSSTYLLRTSRPAYYYVLFDEKGFNADSLQALSYNPCVYMRVVRVLYLWSSDLLCPINLHARDDLLI
ncbi:hypothetical protein RclHR1_12570001 [Rhizophagus clarus]|uniref:Uncharacterized protein n=1 Tax=Rhizophagus clarus TaxID=94130 RepID=A0A2Z6R0E4_9GLOM|nr:hypothetical protein RclHR1_12570001 [Rhizophagus clarus]